LTISSVAAEAASSHSPLMNMPFVYMCGLTPWIPCDLPPC